MISAYSKVHQKLLLLSLIILVVVNSDKIDPNYSYDDFMRQFNRTYQGQQKFQHEQIFNEKYKELVQKISKGQDVKVNNFLDWNETQYKQFFNYRPNTLGRPLSKIPLRSSLSFSYTQFDWRNLNRVTSVKDQLYCGSCWSFATTGQYQSLLSIQTNGTMYDLSEQYAIECQKVYSQGCGGGYPLGALQLFNSTGIPLETSYPYQPSSDKFYSSQGKAICNDSNRIKLTSSTIKMSHYSNLTTQQIQDQLVNSGPLTVAVYAGNSAFTSVGFGGLINNCPTEGGPDHAVLLVGYNSTHWFIKNSWGTSWGHNGYGYILKTNDCKLQTWVDVMTITSGTSPTPQKQGYITYNITMTDQKGDGWNGNILAFKQDNVVVATFGSQFVKGSSYSSQTVSIKNNVQTQIVVAQKGNYTNQVGFTIKNSAGTVIHSRTPGTSFESTFIFKNFCPTSSCPNPTTIDYTTTYLDAYGDGWNGVQLAFRQNGTIQKFGGDFTNGAQAGPKIFTFQKYKSVDIIVNTPGYWAEQIGFIVRNPQGNIVIQRNTGQPFDSNAILGTFCPQCVNLSPVKVVGDSQIREQSKQQEKYNQVPQKQVFLTGSDLQTLQINDHQNQKLIKILMIITVVLASCILLLLLALSCLVLKSYKRNNSPLALAHQGDKTTRSSATINDQFGHSPNFVQKQVQIYDNKFLKPNVRINEKALKCLN